MSTYQSRHAVTDTTPSPQRRLLVRGGLAAAGAAVAGIAVGVPNASAARPTLRRGSRGSAVRTLQSRLNALGFSVGTVDGIFGSATHNAVRAFQQRRGLLVDGAVGEATYRAMREVSGPIIAIALVLCAVFVPLAFISGLTGQFYQQFALTIAISTVISAFNSLTLSPALAARCACAFP